MQDGKEELIPATDANEPRIPTGREVSCRVLDAYFRALTEKKLPPEILTAGIEYPLEYLQDKNRRIDWDSYCIILENASKVWNDEELVAIAETLIGSPLVRPFAIVAKFLFSLKDVYRFGARPGTGVFHQLFQMADGIITDVGPNHILIEYTIHPGYKNSHQFNLVGLGVQKSLPKILGLRNATVKMEEFENGVRYDIWLPKGGESILTRIRQLIVWPFTMRPAIDELREAYNTLQEQNLEMEKEIVARKQAEEERERLILELQEALSRIKLLDGLPPICSFCKKIRNDKGEWEKMETYTRDRSEAEFSHGICPECMERHYPGTS